jgi:hypothetical protein
MIRTTTIPDLATEGLRTLRDRLGPAGMLRFLESVRGGSGDYTQDRARLFDGLSVREIADQIAGDTSVPSTGDQRMELLDEARRVARLDKAEQATWLECVRAALAAHPNIHQIMEDLRRYMDITRVAADARLRVTQAEEMMEADALWKLEGLLSGSLALPQDPREALSVVAYIAIAGHFLPELAKRSAQADAQKFFRDQLGRVAGQ